MGRKSKKSLECTLNFCLFLQKFRLWTKVLSMVGKSYILRQLAMQIG